MVAPVTGEKNRTEPSYNEWYIGITYLHTINTCIIPSIYILYLYIALLDTEQFWIENILVGKIRHMWLQASVTDHTDWVALCDYKYLWLIILTGLLSTTRNTVSKAHKMIPPAPPCFVWQSPCFALGNPKIMRIKT